VRYLFAVIADTTGTITASDVEMEAIDAFNNRIEAAGYRVMAAGIATPDRSLLVDNRDQRGFLRNGPAWETHQFMSGFWIIDADSEAVATSLAMDASAACNRTIEIRPFL